MNDMQDKTILVNKKQVYGQDTYYPASTMAQMVADLLGTKTITDRMVRCLKAYGYSVQVAAQSETL